MSRRVRLGFIAVVAAQLLVLGVMVAKRVHLLRTGATVVLECVPVDPRSILSGDYVQLNYRISRFSAEEVQRLNPTGEQFKLNETVYVALERSSGGRFHEARQLSHDRDRLRQRWPVVIRGTVREGSAWHGLSVRYGVEEYFVPQQQGRRIEQQISRTSVELAVSQAGASGIRRLFIDDQEVVFH
ncbi:MAG: GDYXXLXY domain-containing protein [Deltaproteobacteria bacterium]|nr:GDYXXLXY domain-containing protein [Deltaproteobacteria bacterium]